MPELPDAALPDIDAATELARLGAHGHREAHGPSGEQVVWHCFGQGPPLLLLHGGHGSWLHWARNIGALSTQHRVLVPDMPSFGESDDLLGDPHAEDRLEHLLDRLLVGLTAMLVEPHSSADLRNASLDVAGFSFGGLVAAKLAARMGSVRRLALLGPAGHAQRRRVNVPLLDWRVPDAAKRRAALLQNLESFMFHRRSAADDLALQIHERACLATRFRSKALSMRPDLWPALQAYGGPLLALWGAEDVTCVPTELAALVAQRHAGAQCEIAPDTGHWLAYEQATRVNQRLLAWFGTADNSPRL